MRALPFAFPPALMKTEAAAAYLGMSATKLRAIPDLSPCRVDGLRLYRRADLDEWVASLPTETETAGEDDKRAAREAFGR